jgi:hypothetical protein
MRFYVVYKAVKPEDIAASGIRVPAVPFTHVGSLGVYAPMWDNPIAAESYIDSIHRSGYKLDLVVKEVEVP